MWVIVSREDLTNVHLLSLYEFGCNIRVMLLSCSRDSDRIGQWPLRGSNLCLPWYTRTSSLAQDQPTHSRGLSNNWSPAPVLGSNSCLPWHMKPNVETVLDNGDHWIHTAQHSVNQTHVRTFVMLPFDGNRFMQQKPEVHLPKTDHSTIPLAFPYLETRRIASHFPHLPHHFSLHTATSSCLPRLSHVAPTGQHAL